MRDLGVYVFSTAQSIADHIGVDLLEELAKADLSDSHDNVEVRVKKTKDHGVDFEVNVRITVAGVQFHLETKMNPGSSICQQLAVQLSNGDQITQNHFVHPHTCNGVFLERADGSTEELKDSRNTKASYTE